MFCIGQFIAKRTSKERYQVWGAALLMKIFHHKGPEGHKEFSL